MEMFSDDFISYDNELNVKLEKSSDHDISLDSPSVKTCESTPNLLPMNFSPRLQSLLARTVTFGGVVQKKKQPFTIIKAKKIDTQDHVEVKIESEEKILSKSKLIMKREKAKQRAMTKLNKPICLKIEADVASEAQDTPTGETKNKKKILQMIRNRISAQTSRDRKKAYLYQLEDAKIKLALENTTLKQQNSTLLQEMAKLKEANQRMLKQNNNLRNRSGLDIVELDQAEDKSKNRFEADQDVIERIVRNVVMNGNPSGVIVQDKERLNDVCSFANALSAMVFNQVETQNSKIIDNLDKKGQMQEEDDHYSPSNKLDVKSVFDKINNDDTLFNYTSDLINDKQNTIFQHLTGMPKSNKATFFKPTKENYNHDQNIFSLTNFNLSEKSTEFTSLKDLKQEDSQYSFGIKHSNLL